MQYTRICSALPYHATQGHDVLRHIPANTARKEAVRCDNMIYCNMIQHSITCVYVCMYVCVYIYIYIYTAICIYIYIYIYICVLICTYIYTYIYIYYIYIYIYMIWRAALRIRPQAGPGPPHLRCTMVYIIWFKIIRWYAVIAYHTTEYTMSARSRYSASSRARRKRQVAVSQWHDTMSDSSYSKSHSHILGPQHLMKQGDVQCIIKWLGEGNGILRRAPIVVVYMLCFMKSTISLTNHDDVNMKSTKY